VNNCAYSQIAGGQKSSRDLFTWYICNFYIVDMGIFARIQRGRWSSKHCISSVHHSSHQTLIWRRPLLGTSPNYLFYSIQLVYLHNMSASTMNTPARSSSTTTTESLLRKSSSRTSGSVAMTSRRNSSLLLFQSLDHIANSDRSHDLLVGVGDQFAGRGGYQFPDHLSSSDCFSAQPESTRGHESVGLDSPKREKGSETSTSVAEVTESPAVKVIVTDANTADCETCPRSPYWRMYFSESQELRLKLAWYDSIASWIDFKFGLLADGRIPWLKILFVQMVDRGSDQCGRIDPKLF
jgi:hypothetical protein